MRQPLLFAVLSLLILAGAGCASAPKLTPKGQVNVPATTAAEESRFVTVPFHQEVVIHLPALTTPGTQWTLVMNDTRFTTPWRELTAQPDGTFVASFLAIREGRRTIRFLALPPDQREATATQAYEVRIEIK
ncbi:hypothetical protein [Opitutus sp. ER46]|uniref:hypothetical protein n=1 Tax=Opitutus sp. ER46 TaxID=2161864 RepID=UPI001304EA0F|nr:hypothetical protein [Opitutus sp. ER46]